MLLVFPPFFPLPLISCSGGVIYFFRALCHPVQKIAFLLSTKLFHSLSMIHAATTILRQLDRLLLTVFILSTCECDDACANLRTQLVLKHYAIQARNCLAAQIRHRAIEQGLNLPFPSCPSSFLYTHSLKQVFDIHQFCFLVLVVYKSPFYIKISVCPELPMDGSTYRLLGPPTLSSIKENAQQIFPHANLMEAVSQFEVSFSQVCQGENQDWLSQYQSLKRLV